MSTIEKEVIEKQKKRIRNYLDFCNADLSSIDWREKVRLFYDLMILMMKIDGYIKPTEDREDPKFMEDISLIQQRLKSFLNQVIDKRGVYVLPPKGTTDLRPVLRIELNGVVRIRFHDSAYIDELSLDKRFNITDHPIPGSQYPIDPRSYYLELSLWEDLNGIPITWIRKCKGCERFFLHTTKIEKIYCSSACAARTIKRRERAELYKDPKKHKAYNKKMRKIMAARYKESKRAVLGPKIKVGRKKEG